MVDHRNPDGTFNGATMLAELSGLSTEEIKWTWERAKELKAQGMAKDLIAATLKHEAREKFGTANPKASGNG